MPAIYAIKPLRTILSYVVALLCLLLISISCQPADSAQATYPTRPISYFVPWNPGGGTDTVSRALAVALQNNLGASVNVINRTGGGGVVGHLALSQARPDGYTIGAVTSEITMMHWQGLTDLTVDDYTPIALLMNNPAAITVRSDAPWNTLEELIAAIKASPGDLLASGTSKGGIWDLARIGFLNAAGLPTSSMPWVPSQGAAPALQELLADGVQVVTIALAEAEALYRAGQVKVLAVMADDRLAAFPEIPTLVEKDIDWRIGGWVSVGGPAGMPESVKTTLIEATKAAVSDSIYAMPLQRAGFNLTFMEGEAFASFLEEQDRISGELIKMAGASQ